jgi:hypothetical protein
MKAARRQNEEMDEKVAAVAERARAAGNARPKAEVTTRVDPSIKRERRRGAPDFRQRGLTQRICRGPDCNMEFQPTSPNQRYHNDECRKRAEKERTKGSPPTSPTPPPRRESTPAPPEPQVSASPESQGEPKPRETEEIGWQTVDRFLELLFEIAGDSDEDAAVRVAALELLDDYVAIAVRR